MALASLVSPGCSDETGIVIEVSRDSQVSALETLEFHVGLAGEVEGLVTAIPECNSSNGRQDYYVETTTDAESEVRLEGQDIATDPYRLLLRPKDVDAGTELMVLVIGKQANGNPVGIAQLPNSVSFVEGRAVRWELTLSQPSGGFSAENGCICGPAGAIVSPNDPDCDGAAGDRDCAPNDGFIGPDEPERCDGIDSDCDPNTMFEGEIPCYAGIDGRCFYGIRGCNDRPDNAGSPVGACVPVPGAENEVHPALCQRFEQCERDQEQFQCANKLDSDTFHKVQCELLVTESGTLCPDRSVFLEAEGVIADDACQWSLLGGFEQGPFVGQLKEAASAEPVPMVESCKPIFRLEGLRRPASDLPSEGTVNLFFRHNDGQRFEVWQMDIQVEEVEQCPERNGMEPGLSCDGLENLLQGGTVAQ